MIMKKLFAVLLVGVMLFGFAACGGNSGTNGSTDENGNPGNSETKQTPADGKNNDKGGKLSGTYSVTNADGSKISYTFSGNTLTLIVTKGGAVTMEQTGTYEAKDGVIISTAENGHITETEYSLNGNKLTLLKAWFNQDLELIKE
jgi:hypothetical protein